MQLQKQARKAGRGNPVRIQIVNLNKFNPVIKDGIEIASAHTIHNMDGVTHVCVTSQPKVNNEGVRK